MQIASVTERNRLYETIADMGLVMSPTKAIEMARACRPFYETLPLKEDDINRICYYGKHFLVKTEDVPGSEVWIDGKYINNARIEWVPYTNKPDYMYAVLDDRFPFDTELVYGHNPNIIYRHAIYTDNMSETKTYTYRLSAADAGDIDVYNACYYICNSKYYKPQVSYADGYYSITCLYIGDMDLFIVGNMLYCGAATANIGFVVDDVLEKRVYTQFIVDNDDSYPVNTKFYPWVAVDKDAFLRVYSDTYMEIRNPETCRLINYPEFAEVEDPYNTNNEYLNSFEPSNVIIDASSTDTELYAAFATMVGEWYRCFESYPYYRYDSVFQLHTNTDEYNPEFIQTKLLLSGGVIKDVIISTFPFVTNRDVLFYNGEMLSEYSTAVLQKINDSLYELSPVGSAGYPVYVIDGTLIADKLCVMKFTVTGENTTVKNIDYYLDKDNLLQLHNKINKFYRNVAFLQNAAFNLDELGEEVWVGRDTPATMDDKIWIQLLSVANEDVVKAVSRLVPDSVTGILPESLLQKMAEPLTPEEISTEVHKLYTEQDLTIDDMAHHDIWIQWLDTIKDFVHFSKDNSIIMRVDEHLYSVEIDFNAETSDDVSIIAFDDIVLNFRNNSYGTRYLSILSDLYKSGVVEDKDISVFYKRLITSADTCSLSLTRVKTYTGSVITELARNTADMCVVYSTNLGRIQLTTEHFTDADRTKLGQMIIPYKSIDDLAYLPGRVMLFVNGKLIPTKEIVEIRPFELLLTEFNEMIETIDILYNLIDIPLMKLRRLALAVIPESDDKVETHLPTSTMEPIIATGKTLKGYYDVLFNDYTEGESLQAMLEYYGDHPDEFATFKKDLLEAFSPITNKGGLHDYTGTNKIILWGSLGSQKYTIGQR